MAGGRPQLELQTDSEVRGVAAAAAANFAYAASVPQGIVERTSK